LSDTNGGRSVSIAGDVTAGVSGRLVTADGGVIRARGVDSGDFGGGDAVAVCVDGWAPADGLCSFCCCAGSS
jgi:hypothetical protein